MSIARDGSGPSPQVGDVVGLIRDLSGNGLDARAGSDAARPRLEVIGGQVGLRFDGVDDTLVTDPLPMGPEFSIFVGMQRFGNGVMLGAMDSGQPSMGYFARSNPNWSMYTPMTNGSSSFLSSSAPSDNASLTVRCSLTHQHLSVAGGASKQKALAAPVPTRTTKLVIGDQRVSPNKKIDGALFGLVMFSTTDAPAVLRDDIEAWTQSRTEPTA
ncbi:hypothetical protein [Parvularcula lutaonensis]|uniref:Uncharacterized protein n=1 Tax=Parvularcula lutaonensis TaxID=491923 RepID=A0ABV7MCU5_9PROT|nr:hypothetical protein [Parvularcula lutaonensis]